MVFGAPPSHFACVTSVLAPKILWNPQESPDFEHVLTDSSMGIPASFSLQLMPLLLLILVRPLRKEQLLCVSARLFGRERD